MKRHIPENN
jgi:hypothetical protein